MCIGRPFMILSVDGIAAEASDGGPAQLIDISLVPQARPGDHVLTFLGAAREIVSAEDAALIAAALDGLGRVMEGGEVGDAFADLEAREPSLPPHLAAALAAGRTVA